jgi:Tfp pilus assembly protein PilX
MAAMMAQRPHPLALAAQRGIALPVMLIMMLVMLVTSIYLLKSSNSTTLSASSLAYDATLSRAADFGLHKGFEWIDQKAKSDKGALTAHQPAEGYRATMAPNLSTREEEFWSDSKKVTDSGGTEVEYVIHRLCKSTGTFDDKNACVQTAANTAGLGNATAIGESIRTDGVVYAASPQLHYVITARIHGARGGTVVNQMVVLIGV